MHSVTLVSVYTHDPSLVHTRGPSLVIPFASIALDVRAGAPPGVDDWPDNSEYGGQWRDESNVLASETLGDATHAQLVFMLARHLLQRESQFEGRASWPAIGSQDAIECGWPAMDTALASESWEIGCDARSAVFDEFTNAVVHGSEFTELHHKSHHAQYIRACTIAQKCFADAIKHVAASRAEDAALEARLRDSDIGVSMNTARGWLCFKHFDVHCGMGTVASVSAVSINDSESSVDVEHCKAWVSWRTMIIVQIDRTGVG